MRGFRQRARRDAARNAPCVTQSLVPNLPAYLRHLSSREPGYLRRRQCLQPQSTRTRTFALDGQGFPPPTRQSAEKERERAHREQAQGVGASRAGNIPWRTRCRGEDRPARCMRVLARCVMDISVPGTATAIATPRLARCERALAVSVGPRLACFGVLR